MKAGEALASLAEAMEDELEALVEEGSKRALVADMENVDRITPSLKKMQYLVTPVKSVEDGLKKLQFNFYDLVVVNERFSGVDPADNQILQAVEPMTMDIRRKMFVVVVSRNFKTLDHMAAFARSADIVVNESDFTNLELILKKAIKDKETFYRLFHKALADAGKD
jgi:DNA-binding NtrC family response regulator